ncbi:hypothetical protein [Modestobacter marinus]|uniref:hypothetical protein n=1 Tax=Modestobacter marinus TaxID=477641 RepID=UPI00166C9607|nr:hypothetical protein [Modestobacter marinus]
MLDQALAGVLEAGVDDDDDEASVSLAPEAHRDRVAALGAALVLHGQEVDLLHAGLPEHGAPSHSPAPL